MTICDDHSCIGEVSTQQYWRFYMVLTLWSLKIVYNHRGTLHREMVLFSSVSLSEVILITSQRFKHYFWNVLIFHIQWNWLQSILIQSEAIDKYF